MLCTYCDYRCKNLTNRPDHYLREHSTELPYDCKSCGILYKNASGVVRHVCTSRGTTTSIKSPDEEIVWRPTSDAQTCDASTQTGEEAVLTIVGKETFYTWQSEKITVIKSMSLCKMRFSTVHAWPDWSAPPRSFRKKKFPVCQMPWTATG
jgi:hypothetical protein